MSDIQEVKLLLDKRYTCPVCEKEFKSKAVKTGAAKLIDTEMDLRPRYQNVDAIKYDVVLCPYCGYAALTKNFPTLNNRQRVNLENKVATNYKPREFTHSYYDYAFAEERYKLALLSTMVKGAEYSELGYVCLKLSWLLQNRRDSIEGTTEEQRKEKEKYNKEAMDFSKKALTNLVEARMKESYPIYGMDMPTLDYLLAALYTMDEQLDLALRMLGEVTTSKEATDRLKDKAYDLKQLIAEKKKK